MVQIAIEERRQVLSGLGQRMFGEDLASDRGIGAARDLDFAKIVVDPESVLESAPKRVDTRAATGQQRAVYIE